MSTINVIVDALASQGRGNLSIDLVAQEADSLPAFEAGAHVDVHLPGGLIRPYSIASAPHDKDRYVLCVKRAQTSRGGSAYIHERLRVGDLLQISRPRNLFSLQPAQSHVLMAGGIGITPLLSMAASLDQAGQPFELHYYVQNRHDFAFVRQMATGFTHGQIHHHCSANGGSPRQHLPQAMDVPDAGKRLYLCGPNGFMEHVALAALARGWDASHIHREAFAPPAASAALPGHAFQVKLASSGQVFDIPEGQSIASVLVAASIAVPLSCEMGICGACLTPVVDGIAEHCDSVQNDAEKSATRQLIALCCSRSRTPQLTIDL